MRSAWIHGPRRDVALALLWVPFAVAAFVVRGDPALLARVVAVTLVISLAHQPLTLGLIYGDPAQFRVARRIFAFGPFVFVGAIVLGNYLSLTLVGIVAGLWNAEHTLMQRYGVVRIYGRKTGEGARPDEKPLMFSWLVFALVFGAADARTSRLLDRIDLGATNEAGVRVLVALQPGARLALGPALLFSVWATARWWKKERAIPANQRNRGKYVYLASTFVLFVVMIMHPLIGIVGYVGAHAVEYIVIVQHALGKRYRGPKAQTGGVVGRATRTWLGPTGCVIAYLVTVTLFLTGVGRWLTPTIANTVILTVGGMHVFFDGFIWKLRAPVVAQSLAI